MFFGFATASVLYGGLHALAWPAHFETPAIRLLWRLSSCVVMGGLPIIMILDVLYDFEHTFCNHGRALPFNLFRVLEPRYRKHTRELPFSLIKFKDNLADGIFCLTVVTYILARAFLVVECFIILLHLPAGVYDVPAWSSYFPHIS